LVVFLKKSYHHDAKAGGSEVPTDLRGSSIKLPALPEISDFPALRGTQVAA
jgi:hypothetical protein